MQLFSTTQLLVELVAYGLSHTFKPSRLQTPTYNNLNTQKF